MTMRPSLCRLLVLVLCLSLCALSVKLPDSIKRCSRNDPQLDNCLLEAVPLALKQLKAGDPKMGLQPFDPLDLHAINISIASPAVQLDMVIKTLTVEGISSSIVNKTEYDRATHELDVHMVSPKLRFLSQYEMRGRFLALPFFGKGYGDVNITDVFTVLRAKSHLKKIKGVEYLVPYQVDFDRSYTGGMKLYLSDLFNGDKLLTQSLVQAMNDNWQELEMASRAQFNKLTGEVILDVAKKFFEKVPFDELFPPNPVR